MKIGDNIKKIRIAQKLSQKDFAKLLNNMPVSTLANYENNHRKPSAEILAKMSKILKVPLGSFLSNNESVTKYLINRVDFEKNKSTYIRNLKYYHKVFPGDEDLNNIINRIESDHEVSTEEIANIYNIYRLKLHENNPKFIFNELLKSMGYDADNLDTTYLYDKIREQIRLEVEFMENRIKRFLQDNQDDELEE